MSVLYLILRCELALCAVFGLWSHNWPLIIAGAVCLAVLPVIRDDLVKV